MRPQQYAKNIGSALHGAPATLHELRLDFTYLVLAFTFQGSLQPGHVHYWLRCASAKRSGSAETLSKPPNGPSISNMRNRALPTDTAHKKRTVTTVEFLAATNP